MRKGQSIIEYAVLVALVAAAFIAMNPYIQRSVRGRLTDIQDQINASR